MIKFRIWVYEIMAMWGAHSDENSYILLIKYCRYCTKGKTNMKILFGRAETSGLGHLWDQQCIGGINLYKLKSFIV